VELQKAKVIARPDNKQCVHHWVIDEYNVGHCIKPGCDAVRDFGALLEKQTGDRMGGLGAMIPRR